MERVGVDDSFFDLGGDSILSMQVVARARAAGLICRPRDVFVEQTVARVARWSRCPAGRGVVDGAPAGGGHPIMRWLHDVDGPVGRVQPDRGGAGPRRRQRTDVDGRAAGGAGPARHAAPCGWPTTARVAGR